MRQNPCLLDDVRTVFDDMKNLHNAGIDTSQVENLLSRSFLSLGRAYVLIDAVNESQHVEEILESLSRLSDRCKNLRIFFTTTMTLGGESGNSLIRTFHLQSEDNRDDLRALIDHSLANDIRDCKLAGLGEDPKAEIKRRLMYDANGS